MDTTLSAQEVAGLRSVSSGTIEQLQADIQNTFGFIPPFFAPAIHMPQVFENLWQQTLSAYIHNPLPASFKEKSLAFLCGSLLSHLPQLFPV